MGSLPKIGPRRVSSLTERKVWNMADKTGVVEKGKSTLKNVGKSAGAVGIYRVVSELLGGGILGNLVGAAVAGAIITDKADIIAFVAGDRIISNLLGGGDSGGTGLLI